jgi:XamI restriction endonuclease
MKDAPRWTQEQLQEGLEKAKSIFREERLQEPLEEYLRAFDQYQGAVEDLLETSVDLTQLDQTILDVLTDEALLEAFRYLAGPPISKDDLKVLAEAQLTPARLRKDPEMTKRVLNVVRVGLDRRRFPWVLDEREPTPAEKNAAIMASAALLATSRVGTSRRSEGKNQQETQVEEALLGIDFKKVATRKVSTISQAPKAGEFCRESTLGTRKADFIIGLYDQRIMAIECKVSNSATNSVKRLNNDAAAKAQAWISQFGTLGVVPVAVLSGVYKLVNLVDAQNSGLTVYWAHDLNQLLDWIKSTRSD